MLAESEISQLDMTVLVQKDIVWLQISVNVVKVVDGFDRKDSLANIESWFLLAQDIFPHKQGHEITSWQKLHY